jgi:DNA-binding response OmpR family regulator
MSDNIILLAEDNPDDEALTLRAMRKCNIANTIVVARDGLEVQRRMRADDRTRSIPVVILTTSKEESDLIASHDLGANSYVRKPVDFTTFSDSARTPGMYWRVLNDRLPTRSSS